MRRAGFYAALASMFAATGAAGAAGAAPTLTIKNAAVSIVVHPEDRQDILVEVFRPNSRLPLDVQHYGPDVVIDGHLSRFLTSCHGEGDDLHASILGTGDIPVDQFPRVLVHAPMDVVVNAGGIVRGAISRSQNLALTHSGCGEWTVGNVSGALKADLSGVGSVTTGAAGSADLTLSGAGHLAVGEVASQLKARISGSGGLG
jgi:hypothetical protein